MPLSKSDPNTSILEYALHHFEQELADVVARIDHIRNQLGIKQDDGASADSVTVSATVADAVAPARKKRVLSAAARRKIAAAQKLRWAKVRESKTGETSKKSR